MTTCMYKLYKPESASAVTLMTAVLEESLFDTE